MIERRERRLAIVRWSITAVVLALAWLETSYLTLMIVDVWSVAQKDLCEATSWKMTLFKFAIPAAIGIYLVGARRVGSPWLQVKMFAWLEIWVCTTLAICLVLLLYPLIPEFIPACRSSWFYGSLEVFP